jgi:hypothetical protein
MRGTYDPLRREHKAPEGGRGGQRCIPNRWGELMKRPEESPRPLRQGGGQEFNRNL